MVCISSDVILVLRFLKGCVFVNNIYFSIYNLATDSIEIYIGEKLKIIFNCIQLNNTIFLDDPLDISYLHQLAQEEPFN